MMDQEPDFGDEPLPPPTPEEELAEAWHYWQERAHKAEMQNYRLRSLVRAMLESDPDELAADGGVTVLDVWRKEAEAALSATEREGK